MGSDNSKLEQRSEDERRRNLENARLAEIQRQMEQRAREQQQADWLRAQNLEKRHREMREQEEAKLRKAREEWQRQENLRQQQLQQQQQHLHEQQVQAQILFQRNLEQQRFQQQLAQQRQFEEQKFHRQQLQQQSPGTSLQHPPSPAAPIVPVAKVSSDVRSCRRARSGQRARRDKSQVNNNEEMLNAQAEWTDVDYLQEINGTSKYVAENLIKLFKDDNTIPFIAFYRKDMTLGMNLEELKNIKESYEGIEQIKQKAKDLNNEIHKRGEWTDEIQTFVLGRKTLKELDWIKTMFNISKGNPVRKAKEIGLERPAEDIMKGKGSVDFNILVDPKIEGRKTVEQIRDGIICILAYAICKEKSTLEMIKILHGKYDLSVETTKVKDSNDGENNNPNAEKKKVDQKRYNFYYNFSSFENKLKPYQILEINRAQALKIINVNVKIPADFEKDFKEYCAMHYQSSRKASDLHEALLTEAFDYAWSKSIKSSICTQARKEMTKRAENAMINDIADNTKRLLLTPPVRGNVVIGIEPGPKKACKLAVVSASGDVLETETINPHDVDNPRAKHEAERTLAGMILVHKCTILAVGNGEGHRETENFLSELIKKRAFEPMNVEYTTVDKIAAFTHRCNDENTSEISDAGVAISIARRLLDPMGELVKIDPKKFDSQAYKFNLPAKQLASKVNEAITEAVSLVGVDVNTASVWLLKRVAGLDETKAQSIIEWRTLHGPFKTRNDLKKVRGINSKTYEQCAGFIRITPETAISRKDDEATTDDSFNYLDQTSIHPELYDVAEAFLTAAKCDSRQLGKKAFIFAVSLLKNQGLNELSKRFNTTVETMKIIVDSLSMEKGYDARGKSDTSIFRTNSTSLDDIKVGAVLKGVVRGTATFGAFVDVGSEVQGLIHNTKMKGLTLTRGQKVEVKVNNVDAARRRLGLNLIACT